MSTTFSPKSMWVQCLNLFLNQPPPEPIWTSTTFSPKSMWMQCLNLFLNQPPPPQRPIKKNSLYYRYFAELSDERDSLIKMLLKDGPYGVCQVTGANSLDESEPEYITNGTGTAEVYELSEDSDGMTIWFKDSPGRLFEWCRMGDIWGLARWKV